jgi:hypothetical protein
MWSVFHGIMQSQAKTWMLVVNLIREAKFAPSKLETPPISCANFAPQVFAPEICVLLKSKLSKTHESTIIFCLLL